MPYYKIKIGLRATKVGVGLGSMKEIGRASCRERV